MTIYFIDFENIQQIPPLKTLFPEDKIIILVGSHQTTFKIELVEKFLLVSHVEIIKIAKQGKNNLDFHLCYHLGIQAHCNDKKVNFVIVSNDKDYDPVIATINKQGRKCNRVSTVPAKKAKLKSNKKTTEISKTTPKKTTESLEIAPEIIVNTAEMPVEISNFIENLKAKQKKSRPRKITTFVNALNAFTKKKYTTQVIEIFVKHDILDIDKSKVIYKI